MATFNALSAKFTAPTARTDAGYTTGRDQQGHGKDQQSEIHGKWAKRFGKKTKRRVPFSTPIWLRKSCAGPVGMLDRMFLEEYVGERLAGVLDMSGGNDFDDAACRISDCAGIKAYAHWMHRKDAGARPAPGAGASTIARDWTTAWSTAFSSFTQPSSRSPEGDDNPKDVPWSVDASNRGRGFTEGSKLDMPTGLSVTLPVPFQQLSNQFTQHRSALAGQTDETKYKHLVANDDSPKSMETMTKAMEEYRVWFRTHDCRRGLGNQRYSWRLKKTTRLASAETEDPAYANGVKIGGGADILESRTRRASGSFLMDNDYLPDSILAVGSLSGLAKVPAAASTAFAAVVEYMTAGYYDLSKSRADDLEAEGDDSWKRRRLGSGFSLAYRTAETSVDGAVEKATKVESSVEKAKEALREAEEDRDRENGLHSASEDALADRQEDLETAKAETAEAKEAAEEAEARAASKESAASSAEAAADAAEKSASSGGGEGLEEKAKEAREEAKEARDDANRAQGDLRRAERRLRIAESHEAAALDSMRSAARAEDDHRGRLESADYRLKTAKAALAEAERAAKEDGGKAAKDAEIELELAKCLCTPQYVAELIPRAIRMAGGKGRPEDDLADVEGTTKNGSKISVEAASVAAASIILLPAWSGSQVEAKCGSATIVAGPVEVDELAGGEPDEAKKTELARCESDVLARLNVLRALGLSDMGSVPDCVRRVCEGKRGTRKTKGATTESTLLRRGAVPAAMADIRDSLACMGDTAVVFAGYPTGTGTDDFVAVSWSLSSSEHKESGSSVHDNTYNIDTFSRSRVGGVTFGSGDAEFDVEASCTRISGSGSVHGYFKNETTETSGTVKYMSCLPAEGVPKEDTGPAHEDTVSYSVSKDGKHSSETGGTTYDRWSVSTIRTVDDGAGAASGVPGENDRIESVHGYAVVSGTWTWKTRGVSGVKWTGTYYKYDDPVIKSEEHSGGATVLIPLGTGTVENKGQWSHFKDGLEAAASFRGVNERKIVGEFVRALGSASPIRDPEPLFGIPSAPKANVHDMARQLLRHVGSGSYEQSGSCTMNIYVRHLVLVVKARTRLSLTQSGTGGTGEGDQRVADKGNEQLKV